MISHAEIGHSAVFEFVFCKEQDKKRRILYRYRGLVFRHASKRISITGRQQYRVNYRMLALKKRKIGEPSSHRKYVDARLVHPKLNNNEQCFLNAGLSLKDN